MKLPGLFDFDIEVDLWKIKPDLYIDLRPFPYGMVEQAYAYSSGGDVMVSSKEELATAIDEKTKIGLVLPNNIISSKFLLVPPEKSVEEVAGASFGQDCAIDILFVGDMGLERAYVVNAIDSPSRRIIESQLPVPEPSIVRALPASFVVSQFLVSSEDVSGTFLVIETRPYEIYLYACAVMEGKLVTLSSDVVKSNVKDALSEKIIFMNHKAVRFYRADSILQVFVVGENAPITTDEISQSVLSALKGKAKVSVEVVEETFPSIKGAWLFENSQITQV
jgi:hypothetical protein